MRAAAGVAYTPLIQHSASRGSSTDGASSSVTESAVEVCAASTSTSTSGGLVALPNATQESTSAGLQHLGTPDVQGSSAVPQRSAQVGALSPSSSADGHCDVRLVSSSRQQPLQEEVCIIQVTANNQAHGRQHRRPASLWGKLCHQMCKEFCVGGEMVYKWFIPASTNHHWIMFTPFILTAMLFVFTCMAAQYPYYLAYKAVQKCNKSSPRSCYLDAFPTSYVGPNFLLDWLRPATPATTFDFTFMNMWGARYAPSIAEGQWQLWFTWQFVHTNIIHLVGNLLLLALMASILERRFGWYRVVPVWVVSVAGGAFLSTVTEDPCTQVLGASAGVFGLVGMYLADLVLNNVRLKLPLYRILVIAVFLAVFLGTVLTQKNLSHFSHLGGLLCGFLPTLMILPNKKMDRLQTVLPWVGLLSLVVWFSVLPAYIYQVVLPNLDCPAVDLGI